MEMIRLKQELRHIGRNYSNDALELLGAVNVVREKANNLEQTLCQGASLSETDSFEFVRESAEHLIRSMALNVEMLGVNSLLEMLLEVAGYKRIVGELNEWKAKTDGRTAEVAKLGDVDERQVDWRIGWQWD